MWSKRARLRQTPLTTQTVTAPSSTNHATNLVPLLKKKCFKICCREVLLVIIYKSIDLLLQGASSYEIRRCQEDSLLLVNSTTKAQQHAPRLSPSPSKVQKRKEFFHRDAPPETPLAAAARHPDVPGSWQSCSSVRFAKTSTAAAAAAIIQRQMLTISVDIMKMMEEVFLAMRQIIWAAVRQSR